MNTKRGEALTERAQEGRTKSDGVKLSKGKFELNVRKKALLKYHKLLNAFYGKSWMLTPVDTLIWIKYVCPQKLPQQGDGLDTLLLHI